MSITWGSMTGGTLSKKTKITLAITAAVAIAAIVALKYFKGKKGSSSLPVNGRAGGASGNDIPIATPQAITESAYNQDPADYGDPIMDGSEDEGVLTLE